MGKVADISDFDIAAALKAAGDPMRLQILKIMRRDSFGVLELCQIFSVQQPSMSHHLKVMSRAELLESRREGNSIFYKRAQNTAPTVQRLLDAIFSLADASPIRQVVHEGVERVQQERKARSEHFFQQNVERFREQQDLIAGFNDYGASLLSLMATAKTSEWLEIGPGAGELLQAAAKRYSSTKVLDISEEMLKASQALVGDEGVEYVLGDTSEALRQGISADTISCSMVLHHVPSPASMIRDMADLLNPGGQLLICDLDKHDQEWAHSSCGDLWLGFAVEEIAGWAKEAGLEEGREQYLALRNGFKVQVREFLKAA